MDALHSVSVAKVAELLDLNNLTKEMNLKERAIECSDVNRPALQLSGYFDHFEERRIQIIGNVEYTYIEKMSDSEKKERYSRFMEFDIPCIIFCRDLQPDEIFMEEAREHSIPVLSTGRSTSSFMAELIYCLGEQLAPCITVHGVLVDVYGEGVMITGESGIGKSEAALELIRRGHRLVTDDVVEIRKINEHTLMDLKEKNYLHLQRITEGLYPAARQSASARQQFMLTPQDMALWTLISSSRQERA